MISEFGIEIMNKDREDLPIPTSKRIDERKLF